MPGNAKMSIRVPAEWHSQTNGNMTNAFNSQHVSLRQQDTSKRVQDDCLADNLHSYHNLHSSLQDKCKASQRLIEKLEHRAESVEQTIRNSRNSLAQLEAAIRAKDPPLDLCTWRMEQREKRPLREQVRDPVELCLEEERSLLLEAQRKLVANSKRTQLTIKGLEDQLSDLNQDIAEKMQALSVDDRCLRTTHRSWQASVGRCPPPQGTWTAGTSPRHRQTVDRKLAEDGHRDELARHDNASKHCQTAAGKEGLAKELIAENNKLMDHCKRTCNQARAKTESATQRRIQENQAVRRRLEGEIRETANQIENTKNTMAETRAQMRSLEEPMQLLSTRDTWRKQRALREQIRDPVTTQLEEEKKVLLSTTEALREQRQNEKAVLSDLQANKERLKEDLRDKTVALHIDLNCLAHEAMNWYGKPVKNLTRNKLSKSFKVDPMFTPTSGTVMVPFPDITMPLTAR